MTPVTREAARATLPPWLLARALVLVGIVAAYFVFAMFIEQCDLTPCIQPESQSLASTVAGPDQGLTSWDAWWYIRIARNGYDELLPEAVRYWPLYPAAIRFGAWILLGSETIAALVLSNAAAFVLGILLYHLMTREGAGADAARRAVWLTMLAPPAFVLAMAYTEPIAIGLAVAVFLAMRSGNWGWTAVLGFISGSVRPTALFLMAPILFEAIRSLRAASPRQRLLRAAAVISPAASTAAYLVWAGDRFGDPLLPFTVQNQANGRGGFQFPLTTLLDAGVRLFTENRIDLGLHLLWALLFGVLIVKTFRKWPASYGIYAAVSVIQAISTTNLNSLERYGLAAFPLAMTAATMIPEGRAWRIALVMSGVALLSYATAAFISGYVP